MYLSRSSFTARSQAHQGPVPAAPGTRWTGMPAAMPLLAISGRQPQPRVSSCRGLVSVIAPGPRPHCRPSPRSHDALVGLLWRRWARCMVMKRSGRCPPARGSCHAGSSPSHLAELRCARCPDAGALDHDSASPRPAALDPHDGRAGELGRGGRQRGGRHQLSPSRCAGRPRQSRLAFEHGAPGRVRVRISTAHRSAFEQRISAGNRSCPA